MKGIIAAAGKGSRLFPLTHSVSKHLLPVYNKPLIYYPITNLIASGITDICIITNPHELTLYKKLLGNGKKFGCKFEYCEQKEAKGIPDILNYSIDIFGREPITLLLGDNIIAGSENVLKRLSQKKIEGAKIFARTVHDPSRYGIIELDQNKKILSIEEKPNNPKSNLAIIGLYMFDNLVYEYLQDITPSERGELEITDILKKYYSKNKLTVDLMRRGSVWFDAGTPESLLKASLYVELFEKQSGMMIGSIEEAALNKKIISCQELIKTVNHMPSSNYKDYLIQIINYKK